VQCDDHAPDKWAFAGVDFNPEVEIHDVRHNGTCAVVSAKHQIGSSATHMNPVRNVVRTLIFLLLERFRLRTIGMGM
jgi:hypothetical protein